MFIIEQLIFAIKESEQEVEVCVPDDVRWESTLLRTIRYVDSEQLIKELERIKRINQSV